MQNINSLQNNYILRLIYSLGGITLIYQVIKYQFKKFARLVRNWKSYPKPINLKQNIQQKLVGSGSLLIIKQQVIYGKTKQENLSLLPITIQLNREFLALKKQNTFLHDPCFLLVDPHEEKLQINQCSDIIFKSNIYEKVEGRDFKYDKILKVFGYNKLFFTNITENRIKVFYSSINQFGTPIFVIGDLIINKNTNSVRCYKQYFMGDLGSMRKYLQGQIIQQSCLLLITLCIFSYFMYDIYRIHKKKNKKCSNLQKVIISKGNDSLQCQECKKQLIDTFFSPCGHFNLCYDCSKPYQNCPNCGEYVEETIRTFKN